MSNVTISFDVVGSIQQELNILQEDLSPEKLIEKLNTGEYLTTLEVSHPDLNRTKRSHHVTIIYPDHGLFRQKGNSHLQGAGCPKCRSSKGETRIINILNKYKINYIKEYIIPGAKQRYRYDFYLFDYNILLEFHGGQHYFPVEYFGGVEAFKSLKERDLFKIELAKSARIPLIVFNYKQLKELSEQEFEKSVILKIRGTNV